MIKAKGFMLTRIVCSSLLIIAFLIVFIFDLVSIVDSLFKIILFSLVAFYLSLNIGLSLEADFFHKNSHSFISITILGIILMELYIMITNINNLSINSLIIITNLIGILTWKYALSINKKRKILFFVFGLVYYSVNCALQFNIQLLDHYSILRFIALNVFLSCLVLILITEYIMKRKGYLKYL